MKNYQISDLEQRLTRSDLMPVVFVGHGSPMNAIEDNQFTRQWKQLGSAVGEPQAIVVISAHWLTAGSTRITDAPRNRVIYDFGGFPPELSQVRYESAGDPEVARILAQNLVEYEAQLDAQWGLDHGTWSVLVHLAPQPQVPVLQISIDYSMELSRLHELFARLRALRRRGVLFIGSGNIVHALSQVRWDNGAPWDWAVQFDHDTAEAIAERRLDQLLAPWRSWSEARIAMPTDDHYRPMIASMALLENNEELSFFNTDIDLGSIGMRSFHTLG